MGMVAWVFRRSFRMLRRIGEGAAWVLPCPPYSYLQEPPSHGLLPGFTTYFRYGGLGLSHGGGLLGA